MPHHPEHGLPGATEAGTINWLNTYLSGTDRVWASADGSGFVSLTPRVERVWSGRIARLRQVYRDGARDLDSRARTLRGCTFVDLEPGDQDEVLRAVEHDEESAKAEAAAARTTFVVARANSSTFDERTSGFFDLLVVHTRQAFYSDPVYGGNAGQVGWNSVGFAGPASMADVVTGAYTTLPYFDEEPTR